MIIECKNCLKKFIIKDADIPKKGRTVQCGNCSYQWLQMPVSSKINKNLNVGKKLPETSPLEAIGISEEKKNIFPKKKEATASDGKTYRFLGSQWALILTSGKTGRLAKKKISQELNKLTDIKDTKQSKVKKKTKQPLHQYHEKEKGMGIFSFLIVLIMFVAAIILFLDTFKSQFIHFWPELDNYLIYIFETLNNIYFVIKDLFNNYK